MSLDSNQKATLKAAIIASPTWNAFPNSPDGNLELAKVLSQIASPQVFAWDPRAQLSLLMDAINMDKYTPVDAVPTIPGTPNTGTLAEQLLYMNRLLLIQSKQINLANILLSAAENRTLDGSKVNVRKSVRDAVVQLPAGVSGSNVNAGGANGVNVLQALLRPMRWVEDILKVGSATESGVAGAIMGFQGDISPQDVQEARSS